MTAVARRYAAAAVAVAEAAGGLAAVDALARDLDSFHSTYRASSELRDLLCNPVLRSAREPALQALVQKMGLSREVGRLVLLLARRARLGVLSEVVAETQAAADVRSGRARAHVTTVAALTPAQEQRLVQLLEKRFGCPVVLSVTIDAGILGGLICRVGDVTMDSSMHRQLELLRERLLA